MKSPRAIEHLGYGIADENGDILPVDDVGGDGELPEPNEIRLHRRYQAAKGRRHADSLREYEENNQQIEELRSASGQFAGRNNALISLADEVGRYNQSQGAADLFEQGRAGAIRGASGAERRAERSKQRIKNLGSRACELCPLREYCDERDQISGMLSSTDQLARRRFKNRVSKENASSSTNFCKINLMSGVIPKRLK